MLSLKLDKTHFIHFVTQNSSSIDFNIIHGNKKIANVYNTKFLGLTLDNTLSWRTHIDTIIPKLSSASFALREAILVPRFVEDVILFLLSFRNDLWINILGEFTS